MGIRTTKTEDSLTMKIDGRFNFSCYAQFTESVGQSVMRSYVIDLSAVQYMDSSALGMLLLLRDKVGKDGSRVHIVAGGGQPSQVLRLANFHQLFRIV